MSNVKKYQGQITFLKLLSFLFLFFFDLFFIFNLSSFDTIEDSLFDISFFTLGIAFILLAYSQSISNVVSIQDGQVFIPGIISKWNSLIKYKRKNYFILHVRGMPTYTFEIKNVERVYIASKEEIKRADFSEKNLLFGTKKSVCVIFKQPLKGGPDNYPSFLKRIYFAVRNPEQLVSDLNKLK